MAFGGTTRFRNFELRSTEKAGKMPPAAETLGAGCKAARMLLEAVFRGMPCTGADPPDALGMVASTLLAASPDGARETGREGVRAGGATCGAMIRCGERNTPPGTRACPDPFRLSAPAPGGAMDLRSSAAPQLQLDSVCCPA